MSSKKCQPDHLIGVGYTCEVPRPAFGKLLAVADTGDRYETAPDESTTFGDAVQQGKALSKTLMTTFAGLFAASAITIMIVDHNGREIGTVPIDEDASAY